MLIGVRSKYKLSTEQIPVLYRTRKLINPIMLFFKKNCYFLIRKQVNRSLYYRILADAPNSVLAENIILILLNA